VGDRTVTVPSEPVARARPGERWFLAALPLAGAQREAPPALITPLDGDGRPLGAAHLDCSVGASNAECRRAAGRIASGDTTP